MDAKVGWSVGVTAGMTWQQNPTLSRDGKKGGHAEVGRAVGAGSGGPRRATTEGPCSPTLTLTRRIASCIPRQCLAGPPSPHVALPLPGPAPSPSPSSPTSPCFLVSCGTFDPSRSPTLLPFRCQASLKVPSLLPMLYFITFCPVQCTI